MILRVENRDWTTPQAAGAYTWNEFTWVWPAAGFVTGWKLAEYRESNADDRAELQIRWVRRTREMVTSQSVAAWEPACVTGGRLSFPKWSEMLFPVEALEEWRIQVRRLSSDVIPDLFFRFSPTVEGEGE